MKIAVITMQGVFNYGSVLQTYATQEYLKKKGYEVEIIDYYPHRMRNYGTFTQIYNDAVVFHKSKIKSIIIAALKLRSVNALKRAFYPFVIGNLKKTRKYESNEELCNDPPIADIYCTGSDQVWNDYLEGAFDKAYFLNFAPEGKMKIAYSASFGRDDIKPEELKSVKSFLEDYQAISVREESGLKTLSEIDVGIKECILDPTFMLTGDEWRTIARDTKERGYILVYKLHEDSIVSEAAIEIAKKQNKKVMRLSSDYLKRIKGGTTIVAPDVRQFITYIANADMVVTDSFHATSFAINFNVPFVAVQWKMFNDRIGTILEKTHLQERCVRTVQQAIAISERPIAFEIANQCLQSERMKVDEYLDKALQKR